MINEKLYQPSNGTEGEIFWDGWCHRCVKHPHNPDASNQCAILGRTFIYSTSDKEYPKEWCYDENGRPQCTAFKSREEFNAERRARRKGIIASDKATVDMFGGTP